MSDSLKKVVVWGAGGHALVVADILNCQGVYEVAGFLDDVNPGRAGQLFCETAILGGRDEFPRLRDRGVTHAIVAMGDCAARLRLADVLTAAGFELATAIHPNATIARGVLI